jgi:hypothetical protein
MNSSRYPLLLLLALITVSCKSSFDDSVEYETVAQINDFSVPDTAPSASIPVHIAGLIGKTTASSFKSIFYQRTDSLFEFAVYGRLIDKSNEVYVTKDITFDTTFVISNNPPRTGRHIFIIYGSNGAFADTCKLF